MSQEYITFTIGQKKNIALIAHDNEKQKLIAWCKEHKTKLEKHNLYGTGTMLSGILSGSKPCHIQTN